MLRRDFSRGDLSFGDRIKLFESDLIGKVIGGLYQQLNKVMAVWMLLCLICVYLVRLISWRI
jgi:hypothetical protein